MPKGGEFFKKFIDIDFSGGSYVSNTEGGGVVVDSRFGEFHCVMNDQAEIIANFVDKGVVCTYTDEGNLSIVMLEVSALLKNVDERDIGGMVNGGRDIFGLIDYLDSNGEELFLMFSPKYKKFKVQQTSDGEVFFEQNFDVDDFGKGINGEVAIASMVLAYRVIKSGDEFTISVGECIGKKRSLMPVYLSNKIDIESSVLLSSDPKRYYNLADMIFLNR